jgi:hypothetical protein
MSDPLRRLRDEKRAEKRGEVPERPEVPKRSLVSQGPRSAMPSFRKKVSIDDAIRDAAGELHRPRWIRIS